MSDVSDAALLSSEMAQDLVLLREEEKLARDVYHHLYEHWGSRPFDNIGGAEQRHMDSVGSLLARYDLQDPVVDDAAGQFTHHTFRDLYVALTAAGGASPLAAFQVGAEIEELDLADIARMRARSSRTDVNQVYDRLSCGSRNHLRAFVRQIHGEGGQFAPKHLSEAEVGAILSASPERCGGP